MYVIDFYSDKNESLALLFKIITKIWLLSRQASADEPDILVVEDRLAGMLLQTSCFIIDLLTKLLGRDMNWVHTVTANRFQE